jgi:hypothetical protein
VREERKEEETQKGKGVEHPETSPKKITSSPRKPIKSIKKS